MAVSSKVNPNFPLPGLDQPSKGFRDNFTIIKTEIEALQGKRIQLVGDVIGGPTLLDSGTGTAVIATTSKVYRNSFTVADLVAGVLSVNHNLGEQYVMVQISNDSNTVVTPDSVVLTNSTTATVDLTSYGAIAGTWWVVVRG